jgi:hypothetical protein
VRVCKWCKFEMIPFWRSFCPMCIALREEIEKNLRIEHYEFISTIARMRLIADARKTDNIPGVNRRVSMSEYDGPERRKREGTIYDRRGYLRHSDFSPELLAPMLGIKE